MENNLKSKPKSIRLIELTRMLYQGKCLNVTEACSEIYGYHFSDKHRRNIQSDFKFLIEETELPIEIKKLEKNEREIWILNRNIQSGGKRIRELDIFASFIQKSNNVIFKNTGFQEVLNKTTHILFDHASRDIKNEVLNRDELYDFFENIETGVFNYSKVSAEIQKIINIILNQQLLKCKYQSKSSQTIHEYICVPLKLIYNSGTLYLRIRDLREERSRDESTITLHRIIPGSVKGIDPKDIDEYKFIKIKSIQDNFDIDLIRSQYFGIFWSGNNPREVVLEFKELMVDQIEGRDWHFMPEIKKLKNGNLQMKMTININHELVNWIMARLPFVIIHKPQKLIDMVQERLDQFQKDHS